MAFVFQRRLAVPLWAIAFFAVALTAPPPKALFLMPPTTLFVIATVGLAAIVFSMARAMPWLRTSRALARVRPSGHRDQTNAAIRVAAGTAGSRRVPHREARAFLARPIGEFCSDGVHCGTDTHPPTCHP